MALSALLGQGTTDAGTGTVVYDLNFLIPELAAAGARNAQLEAVVNMQPQISERIRNDLQALGRDAEIQPLQEKLGDLADSTIRFTYNHTSGSLGRSFAQHEESYEGMCRLALDMVDLKEELEGEAAEALPVEEMKARAEMAEMDRETAARVSDIMSATGLKSYHQPVDNQPQFHVTAERKLRDPLVGPDETSVRVTYEGSWRNLNRATEGCAGKWKSTNAAEREESEKCLDQYMKYVDKWEEEIAKAYRFSFSGEYVDSEGEPVNVPGLNPTASARKLVLNAGWGRNFNAGDGGPIKLDLVGSYEDVSDDPKRQDRGIVRLILTRTVGMMSIPFGIVYANHSEFLDDEDVDTRLSAHIGLTFKMPDMNGDR